MQKLANIGMFESLSSCNNVRSVDVFNSGYEGDSGKMLGDLKYGCWDLKNGCLELLEDIESLNNRLHKFGDDPNGIDLKKEFVRIKKALLSYAKLADALSK